LFKSLSHLTDLSWLKVSSHLRRTLSLAADTDPDCAADVSQSVSRRRICLQRLKLGNVCDMLRLVLVCDMLRLVQVLLQLSASLTETCGEACVECCTFTPTAGEFTVQSTSQSAQTHTLYTVLLLQMSWIRVLPSHSCGGT